MSGRRARGTSPRQLGTNPRALGTSPRQLAAHPRATAEPNSAARTADANGVASSLARAAHVAWVREQDPPGTSRAAEIYLAANALAGGPRPVIRSSARPSERHGTAGFRLPDHSVRWAEATAAIGWRPDATGPLSP